MFCIERTYFTIDAKFEVLSNQFQWYLCVHKCLYTFFAFVINSCNKMKISFAMLISVVFEKKNRRRKNKEKKRKRNTHCDSMKITIFLLYS